MKFGFTAEVQLFVRNAKLATKQDLKHFLSPGVEEGKKNILHIYTCSRTNSMHN